MNCRQSTSVNYSFARNTPVYQVQTTLVQTTTIVNEPAGSDDSSSVMLTRTQFARPRTRTWTQVARTEQGQGLKSQGQDKDTDLRSQGQQGLVLQREIQTYLDRHLIPVYAKL